MGTRGWMYSRNDVPIGIYAIPVSLSVTPSARHLSQRARLTHDSNFLAKAKKHKINQQFQSSNKSSKLSQTKKVSSKLKPSIMQQKLQIIANQKLRQRNLGVYGGDTPLGNHYRPTTNRRIQLQVAPTPSGYLGATPLSGGFFAYFFSLLKKLEGRIL